MSFCRKVGMIFQNTDMEYRVHLKQFDGPLDLLIHLIEKAEVDIKDIFVSEITSEFLSYMTELDELDMEQASEFLTVAATLVYANTRLLKKRQKQCASLRMRHTECEPNRPRNSLCRQKK